MDAERSASSERVSRASVEPRIARSWASQAERWLFAAKTSEVKPSKKVVTRPFVAEPVLSPAQRLAADEPPYEGSLTDEDRRAAEVLIKHLFAPAHHRIDRLEYSVAYRLAGGAVGGDIVDVYHFDNGSVAFSIADISGKGAQSAIHAALVKYGIRCFCSSGYSGERAACARSSVFRKHVIRTRRIICERIPGHF